MSNMGVIFQNLHLAAKKKLVNYRKNPRHGNRKITVWISCICGLKAKENNKCGNFIPHVTVNLRSRWSSDAWKKLLEELWSKHKHKSCGKCVTFVAQRGWHKEKLFSSLLCQLHSALIKFYRIKWFIPRQLKSDCKQSLEIKLNFPLARESSLLLSSSREFFRWKLWLCC
jgi:hypothetical protein